MKRLAVFCGSAIGASPVYVQGALALGKEFVQRDITLVYGGSVNGLMGALADTVLEQGGKAIGVLPDFLRSKELAHPGLTELITVSSMHERKARMAELADGFVVLPGGAGTMDEFFEIFTWAQLGLHQKPCGILNIQHYYDPLIALFQHMSREQFLQEKFLAALLVHEHPNELLNQFQHYNPPTVKTFITHRQQI